MIKKGDKKLVNSWAFYDWANSAYPLVITTAIFPIFYENSTRTVLENGVKSDFVKLFGYSFHNSELYAYVSSLSFLIVAMTSPMLSGIADYVGNKKRFLQFFCYLGALSCMSLFFFDPANLGFGMISLLCASIGYWGSIVFYNAYLPEIAEPRDHDRVSAKGYALGYLGSAILLIICLLFIKNVGWLGLDEGDRVFGYSAVGFVTRLSFLAVGVWWVSFAQITFARLPNNIYNRQPSGNVVFKGFKELAKVWNELKTQTRLKRYLLSFFVYSMGVQTVMLMAVLFAKKEIIDMSDADLIISVLLIQFIAIGGSYLFSSLSSRVGNIRALMFAILAWIAVCIGTYLFVYTPKGFYIIAASVGLIMGGIQSLSRSTYAKLLPDTIDHASYFSFYDICEKVGIVLGTFSFGYIEGFTGSMRNSVLALIIFFILGLIFLLWIPKVRENSKPVAV